MKSHSTVGFQNTLLNFCFEQQIHIDPMINGSINSFQPSPATLIRKKYQQDTTWGESLSPSQTKFRKAVCGFSKQHKKINYEFL